MVTSCIQLAFRHTLAVTTLVLSAANPWEIWRCTLACLMRCWLLKSFPRNTAIGVRTFFVMTVKEKGDLSFIGCTTNAAPVVLTIPELSKLIRQIVLPQTSEGNILSFLVFVSVNIVLQNLV